MTFAQKCCDIREVLLTVIRRVQMYA